MRIVKLFAACGITYIVIRVVFSALFGGTLAEDVGVALANVLFPIMLLTMVIRSALGGYTRHEIEWNIAKVVGIGALFLVAAWIIFAVKGIFV